MGQTRPSFVLCSFFSHITWTNIAQFRLKMIKAQMACLGVDPILQDGRCKQKVNSIQSLQSSYKLVKAWGRWDWLHSVAVNGEQVVNFHAVGWGKCPLALATLIKFTRGVGDYARYFNKGIAYRQKLCYTNCSSGELATTNFIPTLDTK